MRLFLLLFITGVCSALSAQASFQVYGSVTDTSSGEKLVACTISEKDGAVLAVTNTTGSYSVSLSPGKHTLVYTQVGYEKKEVSFDLTANKAIYVELVYVPVIDAVNIVAEKAENIAESSRVSSISLSPQAIKKVPVMFGESDVLKVLQLLPGVKPGMEGTSGLYVRGGSPDQNLILLDGTPLYNVSHLYGFFSVFNTDALSYVELIKGGFPARYGGRLSSVLELTMKDGNMRKFRGSANLGLISSNATIEGPIWKDKISFIVSARRTYLDALYTPLVRAATYNPYSKQGYFFYDLNGKINIKPGKNDQILISSYAGDDKFYNDVKPNEILYDGTIYQNESQNHLNWGNRLLSARWNHRHSPKLTSAMVANYTRYRYQVYQMQKNVEINDTGVVSNAMAQDFRSEVKDIGFKYEFDLTPNNRNAIKFGINGIYHRFKPGATSYNLSDAGAGRQFDSVIGSRMVQAVENYAFAENDMLLGKNWKVNYGLHYSQFWLHNKMFHGLQPRLNVRYMLPSEWAIKASVVRMVQYIHLLTNSTVGLPTDLWVPSVKELAPENSYQGTIGVAKTLQKKYLFSTEFYYKTMNGVLDYKNGASFYNTYESWFDKVVRGKGRSYGMEVFLQKKVGKYTGWLAYTLSWTDRIFSQINNGERFFYKYDSRHNISAVMSYEISKKHTLNMTWVFATGNAFTLANTTIQGIDINGNPITINTYDKRNQFRGANYHRLDVSYSWHAYKRWGEASMNLGLYNAYSRRNPFYYSYGVDNNNIKRLYRISLFPVLPFLSFNFVFK